MRTLVDPSSAGPDELLERRRRAGLDRLEYHPLQRSTLIDAGPEQLREAIDWPAT
jgi:hypothetical protein